MAKAKRTNTSKATENRTRGQKRQATLDKKRQIAKKKAEKTNQEKNLQRFQKQCDKVKAQLEEENDPATREELETKLKGLLSSYNQTESGLKQVEEDLMELDADMAQLENDELGGREESVNAGREEGNANATHNDLHTDQKSEGADTSAADKPNATHDDPHIDQQREGADTSAADKPNATHDDLHTDQQREGADTSAADKPNATHDDLHTDQQREGTDTTATDEPLNKPPNEPNLPSTQDETQDEDGDDKNEMFVSQSESSNRGHQSHVNREPDDDPRSAEQPSIHRTKESFDENSLSNKELAHRPTTFDDFDLQNFVDLTGVDDTPTFSLEDGTVSISARGGKLFMNSYGPRNSPMFIWSTTAASYRVDRVTPLLGSPHKQAMLRDDDVDAYLYKGKIGPIKAIAWLPRHGGDSMSSILDSVEELNPSKKLENPKYRYPFSTVMVDLEEIKGHKKQTVWIDRTKYKTLSSAGKDSNARTDRKFYAKACDQVRYFRDWAGKDLDDSWKGVRRERKDESPTPLQETPTPEPEEDSRNQTRYTRSQTAQTPNAQIPREKGSQGEVPLVPQSVDKPSMGDSQPKISNGQNISSESGETVSSEEDEEPELISEFYESFLMKKDVEPETPWRDLDDKIFAQFKAASKIYIKELKKQNPNLKIVDNMGFGKAFKM
ncbi:uncharacterized protein N7484_008221 [Penicillium longicatenatum]|uniref:uncharacterized protein n=1 Tax=Penicillium longicatenatum TaxID=1561947 RepID=UPI002549115B|nr:uncharacterized protein N7484_008221 [Penicillium longicatenatum]KAJ5640359.1 hypothetical protein N7484_008221 [Penicillium longicatenatum]